jgi:hypothetical protein
MIMSSAQAWAQLHDIGEQRRFNIINLESYDLILGTPFLWQHCVMKGFNPSWVAIRSDSALPLKGQEVAEIQSMSADLLDDGLEKLHEILPAEAAVLCKAAEE